MAAVGKRVANLGNTVSKDYTTATVGTNELPSSWPSDTPVYPGATITTAASGAVYGGVKGTAAGFLTTDAPLKAFDVYKAELVQHGWTIVQTTKPGDILVQIGATKDTRELSVNITESPTDSGKTSVQIMSIDQATVPK